MNVLVTGGAGFIGSHLVRKLLASGEKVSIYDSLDPGVHGRSPTLLKAPRLRRVAGDVRDRAALAKEVRRADAIVHLAAAVGVGRSQYQIRHYVDVNVNGTATMLDILANEPHRVRRIVVAGSMCSYGEGACDCRTCGRVRPDLRPSAALRRGRWEPLCPTCGSGVRSTATRESDRLLPRSVYAVTKMAQEELVLNYGLTYGVPSVALRIFNAYGPGQSLLNPYTGVAAIFLSRIKSARAPVVFEDGLQTRDFVSVHDVVQAFELALRRKTVSSRVFNVGTGTATPVADVAGRLAACCGTTLKPRIVRKFRSGDVRHCFADLSAIRDSLGYRPRIGLGEGLRELVDWADSAEAKDAFDRDQAELTRRGLL